MKITGSTKLAILCIIVGLQNGKNKKYRKNLENSNLDFSKYTLIRNNFGTH